MEERESIELRPFAQARRDRSDLLGRVVPHNPFENALLLFRAVPQLGQKFADAPIVPERYLHGDTVACVCGASTAVLDAQIVECDGFCGRHFLRANGLVRAAMLGSTEMAA